MSKSKISRISDFLEGTQHIADPLARYHRAREIRDITSPRGNRPMEVRLQKVKKALKNHMVMASLVVTAGKTTSQIRLYRPDKNEELIL